MFPGLDKPILQIPEADDDLLLDDDDEVMLLLFSPVFAVVRGPPADDCSTVCSIVLGFVFHKTVWSFPQQSVIPHAEGLQINMRIDVMHACTLPSPPSPPGPPVPWW